MSEGCDILMEQLSIQYTSSQKYLKIQEVNFIDYTPQKLPHSLIYLNQFSLENDKISEIIYASNISLYDVASLSNTPSLSTAVLNAVINLSNLYGLVVILPPQSVSTIQAP
jgi:hypothetical protein